MLKEYTIFSFRILSNLPQIKCTIWLCEMSEAVSVVKYEGESVNRSQMDIKHKTCDIRILKKHLFLDISSPNIDTLVPSLYQCVETRNVEVF
jgi:hypothetical protein